MASRRGAVKINPVTGKMEKTEAVALAPGQHRDGALIVDDRYINAAKELGLGGEAGMYGHIKSLARMNAADIPVGTSIEKEGAEAAARAAAGAAPVKPTLDVKNTAAVSAAVRGAMATGAKQVGAAKVHGFGGGKGSSSMHNHEDAFQRRKGVVNTIGGAKDTTRAPKDDARLPAKGERKGAQIMGFDCLDQHTAEGKARREAASKREAAGAGPKPTMVHVTGGGGRALTGSMAPKAVGTGGGGGGGASHHTASSSSDAAPRATTTTVNVLGGASANVLPPDAARDKRAAYFEKLLAEQEAKRKAGGIAAGLA